MLKRIRQLGVLAIVFFTVKGLAWLILPFVITWYAGGEHVRDHSHLFAVVAKTGAALLTCAGVVLWRLGKQYQEVHKSPLKRGRWLGVSLMLAAQFFWIDSYGVLGGIAVSLSLVAVTVVIVLLVQGRCQSSGLAESPSSLPDCSEDQN